MTRDEMLEVLEQEWTTKLVKLSQMVSDNKLSSTAAKEVFQEMHKWYRMTKQNIIKVTV